MLSLPPPPSFQKRTESSTTPLNPIFISKQTMNTHLQQQNPDPTITTKSRKYSLLRPPRPTNRIVWCGAFLCVIFSILLIVTGIVILIIFLVVKPKHPSFDTVAASLNNIYLDSPEYFNGDFTFLANFSNPNRKIDVRFEYVDIELYFHNRLIATQVLNPFTQRRGEARLESVHMLSSEVYLPLNLTVELKNQVESNRVEYNIRGTFRVRASLGLTHISYWLYSRCLVQMSGPPTGVLVARTCRTKR